MKKILLFMIIFLPSKLKIFIYKTIFDFKIDNGCRVGISYINVETLILEENAYIGHGNVIKNLDIVHLNKNSIINNFNWITGFPTGTDSKHFIHQKHRKANLIIGEESAITNQHIFDCTNQITIGSFTTIAGFRSQFLTHSIDLKNSLQNSAPITIGDFCFIGTQSIFLPNTAIPNNSIVSANSLVINQFEEEYSIYAGNPAQKVNTREIKEYKYFQREQGYIY